MMCWHKVLDHFNGGFSHFGVEMRFLDLQLEALVAINGVQIALFPQVDGLKMITYASRVACQCYGPNKAVAMYFYFV